jgi:hypothetical protein
LIQSVKARTRIRRARLPWRALEAEAARQGCSPADIFFDWAGQRVPDGEVRLNQEGLVDRVASECAQGDSNSHDP